MNELKPCPFCGGEPLFVPNPLGTNNANFNMKGNVGLGELVTYECGECGSDCGLYHNEKEAKNAWNTRHEPTCTMEKSLVFGDGGAFEGIGYECSSCKHTFNDVMNYCPNCGCRVASRRDGK